MVPTAHPGSHLLGVEGAEGVCSGVGGHGQRVEAPRAGCGLRDLQGEGEGTGAGTGRVKPSPACRAQPASSNLPSRPRSGTTPRSAVLRARAHSSHWPPCPQPHPQPGRIQTLVQVPQSVPFSGEGGQDTAERAVHCGGRPAIRLPSSPSPSPRLPPATPRARTHPSEPGPRNCAARGHSLGVAARGGPRGPGTPGSEIGWEQSRGDDPPVGEGEGLKGAASFRASHPASRGPHPTSPARWCRPWQSSVCTICGWSASPSWVSRSSPRPGKSR